MTVTTLTALTCAIVGLLFVGLSIPLLLNKVPPNPWYGFRTRLTLGDPEIWYPVNVLGARGLLWIGVATWFLGLGSLLLPEAWLPAYLLVICVLWVLALSVVVILGVRYARRLAETR